MADQPVGQNQPLNVWVVDGRLEISIGVDVLAHAAACSSWATPYDAKALDYIRTFAISDARLFAREVARAMRDEREDGSSLLTDIIDKAARAAVDDGAEGLHDEDVHLPAGSFAACESWATTLKVSR